MKSIAHVVLTLATVWLSTAQAQSFGTWDTGTVDSGDALYATTGNDSGNLLGQYCFPADGSCFWLLGMSTGCKEGDQYPVLSNSDAGSAHLEVLCSTQLDNGLYRYVFTDFDAIDNIVTKGLRAGFAVPLQGDQFRVVRFDLRGSNRAVAVMKSAAARAQRSSPAKPTGTKDQVM